MIYIYILIFHIRRNLKSEYIIYIGSCGLIRPHANSEQFKKLSDFLYFHLEIMGFSSYIGTGLQY